MSTVLGVFHDLLCGSKALLHGRNLICPQKDWQPATAAHVDSAGSQFVGGRRLNRDGGCKSFPSSVE